MLLGIPTTSVSSLSWNGGGGPDDGMKIGVLGTVCYRTRLRVSLGLVLWALSAQGDEGTACWLGGSMGWRCLMIDSDSDSSGFSVFLNKPCMEQRMNLRLRVLKSVQKQAESSRQSSEYEFVAPTCKAHHEPLGYMRRTDHNPRQVLTRALQSEPQAQPCMQSPSGFLYIIFDTYAPRRRPHRPITLTLLGL
jgi:hypothetical protein